MAGVSVGFAKCFMLFMAVVILAQGLVYLGLAIWGITLKDCQTTTDIVNEPLKFAMDLIYFVDESCGEPAVQVGTETFPIQIDWTKSFAVTNREYIFMITYAVVSGLWIASSALIILTLCFTTTKLMIGTIYWPWFLSVMAGCILDVVATVYHGLDISHTLSMNDAFDFIGAEMPELPAGIMSILLSFGVYFTTPAIILTCISSRVVLIWLLNLIGSVFCLSVSNVLANQATSKSVASGSQASTRQQTPQPMYTPPEPRPRLLDEEVHQEPTAPIPSASASIATEPQYPEQIHPKPLPIIIPAQKAEMLQRQDSAFQAHDRTTVQSPVMVLPPHPAQQSQQQQLSPQPQPEINTYRTTDAHPDQLNYPVAEAISTRPTSPAAQQMATDSALNSRYSEIYPAQPRSRVSEELRNQMPWTYATMLTKPPPPPRKPQQQVQIYPQIPEPDYTEH